MQSPALVPSKQAIAGSLLIHSVPSSSTQSLAVWYRIGPSTSKIIKMQRITSETLSYRCTVFDVGCVIELRMEDEDGQSKEVRGFGPVKYDAYVLKQLEEAGGTCGVFNVRVHVRASLDVYARVQAFFTEDGEIMLDLSVLEKRNTFVLAKIQEHDLLEEIMVIDSARLNEIMFKNIRKNATNEQKLSQMGFLAEGKSYLTVSFLNAVQRNLFLGQILNFVINSKNKTKLRHMADSESSESEMENQIDNLFGNKPEENSVISEKVLNDFRQVIQTPKQVLTNQEQKNKFQKQMFHLFLNPEQEQPEPEPEKASPSQNVLLFTQQDQSPQIIKQAETKPSKIKPSLSHKIIKLRQTEKFVPKRIDLETMNKNLNSSVRDVNKILSDQRLLIKQNNRLKTRLAISKQKAYQPRSVLHSPSPSREDLHSRTNKPSKARNGNNSQSSNSVSHVAPSQMTTAASTWYDSRKCIRNTEFQEEPRETKPRFNTVSFKQSPALNLLRGSDRTNR